MVKGFKEFIARGNVVDLAVGVIIGGAFTPIVTAVTDVILGFIGAIFGTPNFDHVWTVTVVQGKEPIYPLTILTAMVNFLLVAFALYFFVVMPMNRLHARTAKEKAAEPTPIPEDVQLLTEIRDLLARDPSSTHRS